MYINYKRLSVKVTTVTLVFLFMNMYFIPNNIFAIQVQTFQVDNIVYIPIFPWGDFQNPSVLVQLLILVIMCLM